MPSQGSGAPADRGRVTPMHSNSPTHADGDVCTGTARRRGILSRRSREGRRLNAGHSERDLDGDGCGARARPAPCRSSVLRDEQRLVARLRCGTPMQASMLEFVLATADMTTEVIADGRHLSPELLRFVVVVKGADKTALVTDCSRALDQPPGVSPLVRSTAARRSTATAVSACFLIRREPRPACAGWTSWCGTCTSRSASISRPRCDTNALERVLGAREASLAKRVVAAPGERYIRC